MGFSRSPSFPLLLLSKSNILHIVHICRARFDEGLMIMIEDEKVRRSVDHWQGGSWESEHSRRGDLGHNSVIILNELVKQDNDTMKQWLGIVPSTKNTKLVAGLIFLHFLKIPKYCCIRLEFVNFSSTSLCYSQFKQKCFSPNAPFLPQFKFSRCFQQVYTWTFF